MIYRFRIILDTEEDVFRDIEIEQDATLEQFHNVINQSFGFDGLEMASFYISDQQWNQGEEISLFDMSDGNQPVRLMNETTLIDVVHEASPRLLYIYDFLSMWTFLVELAEIAEYENGREYPNVMFVHGQLPEVAPNQEFKTEDNTNEDDKDNDSLDLDDYEELGFDENWN
ncbi:plasmid pRiA4b ORF-3 family protein [Aquimarina sp. RZ0]|uniref:IS1096 element passenger TnpR family protein n=1 Tax=Aquimarina sp. RZ0 TaxID=2607730 RepID=UPI0011F3FA51|nr:plasmid pRiA4b ORF-3 family protein [Aquimarina sp. RZ0]KAA1247851.1 plasmid pRiA4b ORF-3 family protein [Aquimarina sp. RZ0]